MYHVFICYPRTYLAQVTPLHDALELMLRNIYRRDAQVFQDTSDLQAANKWEGDINTALEESRVMIVVVVPTILESPQCRREMMRFIQTPGKHIIPLICEEVPRLRRLAEGIDDHPEGSEDHDIAVCAKALQDWQAYDFSKVVYVNPNETAYKTAISELARMIRNKLDYEDQAAAAPHEPEPKPERPHVENRPVTPPPADPVVHYTSGDGKSGKDGGGKPRRGVLVAALAVVLAAGGIGLWALRDTPDPVVKLDRTRATALLGQAMTKAVGQAEHLSFDPESGVLRVAAPPVGSVTTRLALQPAIDPMLKAGFVPGFAETGGEGRACFAIHGDPMTLEGRELSDGEFVDVKLRVYDPSATAIQKFCTTAGSTWSKLTGTAAEVNNGAIFAAPRDDAQQLRTLRAGQEVPGPFWFNNDVPGWVRFEYRGVFAYFRRDIVRTLK